LVLRPTLLGMNQHNLTPALAVRRAADVQRAARHSTATLPPRRHLHALALLGLIVAAVTAPLDLGPVRGRGGGGIRELANRGWSAYG
jgi:hypothetical protein